MKKYYISCFFIIFSAISVLFARENPVNELPQDCGPQCVKYLSRYFNRSVTLEETFSLFGIKEAKRVNMLDLKKALNKLDLNCFGFRGKIQYIKDEAFRNCAFIVALEKKDHFIVVAKAKNSDDWLWIDPSRNKVVSFQEELFEKDKDYAILAVSDTKIIADTAKKTSLMELKLIWIPFVFLAVTFYIFRVIKKGTIDEK